jgi:hypothetical protein
MAFGDFTVTRASTKLRIGSNGLYGSVANNVPAFEFNTNGTYRGLLVEPGATNLALQSQAFNEAVWTKTDATITANSVVSPDGATTADTITEGTAGTGLLTQAVTVSAGATATASIYLKIGSANTFVRVMLGNDASFGDRVQTWINLSTGALSDTGNLGTGTGASASVLALPNGWYRVSISGAIPTATGYRLYVNSASASGSATRVNNSVYYAWQAQIETGSVATSPIVTTAGTASRVADVVSLTGASSLIGQTEGVVYAEVVSRSVNLPTVGRIVTLSDGTTNNRIGLTRQANFNNRFQGLVVNSTTITAQIQQGADVAENAVTRMAIAYATDDIAFYINGASIGTDTSSAVPACSRIDIGNQLGAEQFLNGWIRSVALFPTRLANATLASLTA